MKSYLQIINNASQQESRKIAVAGAEGRSVLEALKSAMKENIAIPVLVGDAAKIESTAQDLNMDLSGIEIHNVTDETEIAQRAVRLVHDGAADALMKGNIPTPTLLKQVLNKDYNLRTGRLLSHAAVLEIPVYHKLVMITDGGMVIRPTLEQKADIIRNGVQIMHKLDVARPKIAALAAIEKITPDMPETEDARQLEEMALHGELGSCEVEGPMAIDVAFSREAAEKKGIDSRIAGTPDILLMPDISSGNIFAKGLWHLASAQIGGLIIGARVSIILLSRSDDAKTKLNSLALAAVTAE
ncbi:bifunctional enoyl-CoA hydratase/phosphate acetyltransferase [bacterium]|nr:bifunctional enoyl-CoA hydratase/phosphate acetyltransferase [bacterium]